MLHLNFHVQFQWALSHALLSAPSACTSIFLPSVAVSLQNKCISAPRALRRLLGCRPGAPSCPDLCTRAAPGGAVFVVPQGIFGALGYFQHQAPSRSSQRCVSVRQNLENLGFVVPPQGWGCKPWKEPCLEVQQAALQLSQPYKSTYK